MSAPKDCRKCRFCSRDPSHARGPLRCIARTRKGRFLMYAWAAEKKGCPPPSHCYLLQPVTSMPRMPSLSRGRASRLDKFLAELVVRVETLERNAAIAALSKVGK